MNQNEAGERVLELQKILKRDRPWSALIEFLDSVGSLGELEALDPVLIAAGKKDLSQHCREGLTKWENPQLSESFREECPLLAARLDTPQKIRIFLRGANSLQVDPLFMGKVLEDILTRHEVRGEKKVAYPNGGDDPQRKALAKALTIVYLTHQPAAWSLVHLALPGVVSAGVTSEGLYVDWRTREEMKAVGEEI